MACRLSPMLEYHQLYHRELTSVKSQSMSALSGGGVTCLNISCRFDQSPRPIETKCMVAWLCNKIYPPPPLKKQKHTKKNHVKPNFCQLPFIHGVLPNFAQGNDLTEIDVIKERDSGTSSSTFGLIKMLAWLNNKAPNAVIYSIHDDVINWKHFPRYLTFAQGIHWSPVNSPHKGQWRGALIFSLICAWIKVELPIVRLVNWDAIVPIMTSLLCKIPVSIRQNTTTR